MKTVIAAALLLAAVLPPLATVLSQSMPVALSSAPCSFTGGVCEVFIIPDAVGPDGTVYTFDPIVIPGHH